MTERLKNPDAEHVPVMSKEVLDLLQCKPGGIYVDGTVGLGGHAQAILEKIQPDGMLIGLDRDKESLEKAQNRLKSFAGNCRLFHDNGDRYEYFRSMTITNRHGFRPLETIVTPGLIFGQL